MEVQTGYSLSQLQEYQQKDNTLHKLTSNISRNIKPPYQPHQKNLKFRQWIQLWPQLFIKDGILYRIIKTPGCDEYDVVLVAPPSLQLFYIQQCHDASAAGHLGFQKTLERLRRQVYWVGMAKDVHLYCNSCEMCQRYKPSLPPHIPMINTPIGRPWEMVAVDILKVPPSTKGSIYLLLLLHKVARGHTHQRPNS